MGEERAMADRFLETKRDAAQARERAEQRMEAARRRRTEISAQLGLIVGEVYDTHRFVTAAQHLREAEERTARAHASALRARERSEVVIARSAAAPETAESFGTQLARFGHVTAGAPSAPWLRRTEASRVWSEARLSRAGS
jgi:hypothetical protein